MSGKRWAMLASVAVVAAVVWGMWRVAWVASRGGETAPLYSSQRYDPYGTAAWCQLLGERGHRIELLRRPRLEEGERGVLIQVIGLPDDRLGGEEDGGQERGERRRGDGLVVPEAGRLAEMTTGELADWIAQGNTVVQMTRLYTPLMAFLGVPRVEQAEGFASLAAVLEQDQRRGKDPQRLLGTPVAAHWVGPAGGLEGRPIEPLHLLHPRSFGPAGQGAGGVGGRWEALAVALDRVVAGQVRHGRGRLIVVGCPTPILNGFIGEGGNLRFLLSVVGGEAVIVDEWQHGLGRPEGLMDLLRRFGLLPVLVQVVVMLGVYRWSTRGLWRSGEGVGQPRRASVEQIRTLGALYRRSLGGEELRRRVEAEVRRRLAGLLRCRADRLEAELGRQGGAAAERAGAIWSAMQRCGRGVGAVRRAGMERELASLLEQSGALVEEYGRE